MAHPGDKFVWFLGIIDSIDDPKQLGRVKVRVINEHDTSIDSEDLPWAIVLGSTTSASYLGVGTSPVGLQVGSRVVGFYLDDTKKTKPVIFGSIPFIKDGVDADHSVSAVARGKAPVHKDYLEYEPNSDYRAEYPYNNTITTKSGHVIEIDDTPKGERIHVFHKTGSYVEFFPNGDIVSKATGKYVDISMKDKHIISDDGEINLTSRNNLNVASQDGDIAINTPKDIGVIAGGGVVISGANGVEINGDGSVTIKGNSLTLRGGSITLSGSVNVQGSLTVNGRPVK